MSDHLLYMLYIWYTDSETDYWPSKVTQGHQQCHHSLHVDRLDLIKEWKSRLDFSQRNTAETTWKVDQGDWWLQWHNSVGHVSLCISDL